MQMARYFANRDVARHGQPGRFVGAAQYDWRQVCVDGLAALVTAIFWHSRVHVVGRQPRRVLDRPEGVSIVCAVEPVNVNVGVKFGGRLPDAAE
ncbi:MAG: hypothetical protein CL678_00490 [Bdellovibrionaceae bacterium]|nr:hypothetical protein [Pseudobdellovibrionaceae bacterium]